jgi:transposase
MMNLSSIFACLPTFLPLYKTNNMKGPYHPVSVRTQALTLINYSSLPIEKIEAITGMNCQTIRYWNKKARERGFNPEADKRILIEYVQDSQHSGRPKIGESKKEAILETIQKDRSGREKSCEMLAFDVFISPVSAWRIIQQNGFASVKPTTKPGFTDEIKKIRL